MCTRNIGGVVEASPIALGCMRMASLGVQQAERVVLAAVEQGVTFFDHADIYGGGASERVFGEVLRRNPSLRKTILLQDKCGICNGYYDASKAHILNAVDGSLQRLGVEQLDFLLLHRPDALMEPAEVAEAFDELHHAGKVRFFGVSNQNAAQLELLRREGGQPLVVNQLQYGPAHTLLVDEGINVNIHSEQALSRTGGTLDYCRLHHITIQAWSPFQHGMFEGSFMASDKYKALNDALGELAREKGMTSAAIAIAWILRHPAGIQPIAGTMDPEHLRQLCAGANLLLTREEWYRLYLAAGNPLP